MAKGIPGFGGLGGLGDMGKMLKQAQKAAEQMKGIEAKLASERVEGSSGGGMVKVTATGTGDVVSVQISKDVVDPDDVEMLEDLVLSALREALAHAAELREKTVSSITGGMDLPKGLLGG
jgi:hypothetical protein